MTNHKEKARELFISGCNCSQAVFGAFCDVTGMDLETALRISSPFGGGMGRMREVCGACSGMFMAAGLLFGYSNVETDAEKAAHYKLIQRMAQEFKDRNSDTIICRELLKTLKPTETPQPTKRDENFYKVRPCVKFVEDAAEILDMIIEENKKA